MKGCVFIARPLHVARDMAERLAARGWDSFIEPLLTVTPIDVPLPDLTRFTALAFTSGHGVEEFAARSAKRDYRIYAVGQETALRAREAGFTDICISADGNLKALNQLLASDGARDVLHVGGRHIAGDVIADGKAVEHLALYAAHPVTDLSAECRARFDARQVTHATFFSRRTGETFSRLIGKHEAALTAKLTAINALSLSDSVLESVAALPWRSCRAARTPDWPGMLALLEESN